MALILPYPTLSGAFSITGSTVDVFTPTTVHNDTNHNNPHAKLLENDIAIKTYIDTFNTIWSDRWFSLNGWQKFPQSGGFGLILQWATGVAVTSEGSQVIFWPISFDTACMFAIVSTHASIASSLVSVHFQTLAFTSNSVIVYAQGGAPSFPAATPYVIGLGY